VIKAVPVDGAEGSNGTRMPGPVGPLGCAWSPRAPGPARGKRPDRPKRRLLNRARLGVRSQPGTEVASRPVPIAESRPPGRW